MPKISIILPVYNGAYYLEEAIDSILTQTFADFELIIIDDYSSDTSGDIAQKHAALDPRISYYRNNTNLKLPLSLNRGFSYATGEYYTWTSCDNILKNNALEVMLRAIESQPSVGLVYTSMHLIDKEGSIIGQLDAGPAEDLIYRNVVGACFMYRAHLAEKVGPYDPSMFLCEDYDYWLRIAMYSKIAPILECLYLYRYHPQSLSNQNKKEVISKGIQLQKRFYCHFIHTRKQAANFFAHLRARDIYNPFRQLYLLKVLYYHPLIFIQEFIEIIKRRFDE